MSEPTWDEFRRRCSKPNGERLGTWTARRVARPIALRMTMVIAPTGISAHAVTLASLLVAVAASCAFAVGTPFGWLIGALLLEFWYVLDHVDGQLARWRKAASLDGTMLDYLMHHAVNLIVPQAIAFGMMQIGGGAGWFVVGLAWSCGLVLLNARHDARYKAFIQRLKIVDGELTAVGGGGGRPVPAVWPEPNIRAAASWCCQKVCEMHVLAHLLVVAAVVRFFTTFEVAIAQTVIGLLTLPAVLLPIVVISRAIRRGEAEAEFASWYRVPHDATLAFRDGRYVVESPVVTAPPPPAVAPQRDVVRTS